MNTVVLNRYRITNSVPSQLRHNLLINTIHTSLDILFRLVNVMIMWSLIASSSLSAHIIQHFVVALVLIDCDRFLISFSGS